MFRRALDFSKEASSPIATPVDGDSSLAGPDVGQGADSDSCKSLEDNLGRRRSSRLRLAGPGRLIAHHGVEGVRLDNLSLTGAHLSRRSTEQFTECILRWLDFEAMGRVVWFDGHYCGMKFHSPLPEAWLVETRSQLPDVPECLKLPVPSRLRWL